eukprot:Rhum_TRINITY_DN8552_c0_g2::Rhum_TRINITY_DN8552_c0_g2_i1::g.28626::m.28626
MMAEAHALVEHRAKGLAGVEGHTAVRVSGDAVLRYGGRTKHREITGLAFYLRFEDMEWRELRCSGYAPVGRCYHTADVFAGRMVVFGGLTCVGWDDAHFNNYNVMVSPDMLDPHALAEKGTARFRDVLRPLTQAADEPYCYHELDLLTSVWSSPATTGDLPEARSHHASAVHDSKLYVYGGYNTQSSGRLADDRQKALYNVHTLDLTERVWRQVDVTGSIPPLLWGHRAVVHDGILFTLGGVDALVAREEGYVCAFNAEEREWRWLLHSDDRAMGPRAQHSVVVHGERAVVFGGCSDVASDLHDAVHVFDFSTGAWVQPLCTGEAPTPRRGHTAVLLDGGRMMVTGGIDAEGHRTSRSFVLDLTTWHWEALSTPFNDVPLSSLADDSAKVRRRLQAVHARRRKAKEALMQQAPDTVRIEYVLVPPEDAEPGAFKGWGFTLDEERPCVVSAVAPDTPADGRLSAGMTVRAVNGEHVASNEEATALMEAETKHLRLLVEQHVDDVPPSPPPSDDEADAADAAAAPSPMDAAANPGAFTQTPAVPALSQPAAALAANPTHFGLLSPRRQAAHAAQAFGHNVFTASATNGQPAALPPRDPPQGFDLGRYGFVESSPLGGGGPLFTPPSPQFSAGSHQPQLTHQPPPPPPPPLDAAVMRAPAAHYRPPAQPLPPPQPKVADTMRAWSLFPTASVRPTTNARRTRYLSPSIVKLGMSGQLAVHKPPALRGPFNGSDAAAHPYGRSLAQDQFGFDDSGGRFEGPQNFVTTTNTAIPDGLGPISSAAFLTGLHRTGPPPPPGGGLDPETQLSQIPVDIRNAAAAAYQDQWAHWTWEDRLQAVRRYAEFYARRSAAAGEGSEHLPPVLAPPEEGADGFNNLPAHVAAHPTHAEGGGHFM